MNPVYMKYFWFGLSILILLVIIFVIIFKGKSIWDYLKPTWEGDDGKVSYRRSSQFVFVCLIIFIVVSGKTLSSWGFWTLVVLSLVFLLLAAIITGQQIIDGIKGIGSLKNIIKLQGAEVTEDEKITETKTTIEVPPEKDSPKMEKKEFFDEE